MTDAEFIRNVFIAMGAAHLSDTQENREKVLHGINVTRQAWLAFVNEESAKETPVYPRPADAPSPKRHVSFVLDGADADWMDDFTKRTGTAAEVFITQDEQWRAEMRDVPGGKILFAHVFAVARDALKALRKDAERWEEDRPR